MLHGLNMKQVVSKECKLLKKSRSHTSGGCEGGKCVLCVHTEDVKNSLRKYFKSMLEKKCRNIKTLDNKQQVPKAEANFDQLRSQEIKILAKTVLKCLAKKDVTSSDGPTISTSTLNMKQQNSTKCEHFETAHLEKNTEQISCLRESDHSKALSFQQLNYHDRRRTHSDEVQHSRKRFKSSLLGLKEDKTRQRESGHITFGNKSGHTDEERKIYASTSHGICTEMSSGDQNLQNILAADTQAMSYSSQLIKEVSSDRNSSDDGQQLLVVPETQTVGYFSKLDEIEDVSFKLDTLEDVNWNSPDGNRTFCIPEIQTGDYSSTCNNSNHVKNNNVDNLQIIAVPETQIMGYSSAPGIAVDVKNNKDCEDQQILDMQPAEYIDDLSKSGVNLITRKCNDNQQMLCVQKAQTEDSLYNIIYVSDEDEDGADVIQMNSGPEHASHNENALSPDDDLPESSHFMMMAERQTKIQNQILDESVSQYMVPQEKTPASVLCARLSCPTKRTRKCKSFRAQPSQNVSIIDVRHTAQEGSLDLRRAVDTNNINLEPAYITVPDTEQEASVETFLDSFDVIPKQVVHEFPHVSVERKKQTRKKFEGSSCKHCYDYYRNHALSKKALKEKMNDISRHRERYKAPNTPLHFWSLGFPDTAEMNEQTSGKCPIDSSKVAERGPRRRKPLEKRF